MSGHETHLSDASSMVIKLLAQASALRAVRWTDFKKTFDLAFDPKLISEFRDVCCNLHMIGNNCAEYKHLGQKT